MGPTSTATTTAGMHTEDFHKPQRLHLRARRLSSPTPQSPPPFALVLQSPPPTLPCHPAQSLGLEALDLHPSALASIRFLVLSHLADLEARITPFKSQLSGEAIAHLRVALDVLSVIKQDLYKHLPAATELRASLPEVHFPDLHDFDFHVPAQLSEVDFSALKDSRDRLKALVPALSEQLHTLHDHLSSLFNQQCAHSPFYIPSVPPSHRSETEPVVPALPPMASLKEEAKLVAQGISQALKHSLHGTRLIKFTDLPEQWQSNPFIRSGYRFIPIEKWYLIVGSWLVLHNEFLNIHTHFVPLLIWFPSVLRHLPVSVAFPTFFLNSLWPLQHFSASSSTSVFADTPELVYIAFASLTLALSVTWHTMAGCADHRGMDLCARVDYVGIGWLIAASIGTVVYYGFQECNIDLCWFFLGLAMVSGMLCSIFPFMNWFNQDSYRLHRCAFFFGMSFAILIAPMSTLAYIHSPAGVARFLQPMAPSVLSYIAGFVFYVTRFPERLLSHAWLEAVGWGSHAIWHMFIVSAIMLHRMGMADLRAGIEGAVCALPS